LQTKKNEEKQRLEKKKNQPFVRRQYVAEVREDKFITLLTT